ncbi:MAG TPA: hypothetical protein VF984_04735 [Actinomycetota bacterium]
MGEFEPEKILEALERNGVRYVVIGGFAGIIHGSPHGTGDVDITPEQSRDNLERLSRVLVELNARIRTAGEPDGLAFDHDAASLSRTRVWNLVTKYGDLDLTFEPSGTRGYKDLAARALRVRLPHVETTVAALEDVIRSKEAAGRLKDQITLATLRRILEEGG